jgi:LuxR family maltose regulon positive regulatory protein
VAKKPDVRSVKQPPAQNSRSHTPPSFMFRPVRTRLLDELEGQGHGGPKLLSIVAPIGYGKTVVMSELHAFLQQIGEHCYWVGLDDRHTSVDRVLNAIKASIIGPRDDPHPAQAFLRGDEPIESRIDEVIELVAGLPVSSTIFIDNLNSCADEALGAFLDVLIFRTSSSVRFVWSTTTDPSINLGRAKLEGLIRQIGFSELSLDAKETRELLGDDLGVHIGNPGVEAILRQTEGWPAAIRMAQIILAESDQPLAALNAFSGSDEDVSALLNRQVLKGFSPELREFLLRIAQLRTFSMELCCHATGMDDAASHLDFLLRRNVFVIPLDRNRKRYRLHGLFREYLLGEADRQLSLQQKRDVLERAAQWCEQHEDWHDAIDYALAAGVALKACRMLDRTARIFVREHGDVQQYISWVERLLLENVQIGLKTHFWYVWALIFQRRYQHGLQQQRQLADRLRQHALTNAPSTDLSQRIDHLRICLDLFTDNLADAQSGVERWMEGEKTNDPYTTGSIGCIKSICLASSFKLAQAKRAMGIVQPILLEIGGAYTVGWVSLIQGILSTYEGDYPHAYRELASGLTRARSRLGDEAVLCGTMAFVGSKCAVEMGLKDEARNLFIVGLKTAQNNVLVDTVACGLDAAVKLWNGSADELVSIPRLREIARGYPLRLSLMLSCYLVRRLLCLGRLDDALDEAERIGLNVKRGNVRGADTHEFAIPRYRDLFMATAIDLHIATRQFKQAETLIEHESRLALEDERTARQVELGLSKAAIAMHTNKLAVATKELTLAVSRAARRRIVRSFHDQAELVATLVNDTKPSSWPFALNEERDFFTEICRDLPIGEHGLRGRSAIRTDDPGPLVAPTKREAELLTLLNTGLSNQQIADYSNVSIGTIKWHLKNLYRKLGVANRSSALARARVLRLLSN